MLRPFVFFLALFALCGCKVAVINVIGGEVQSNASGTCLAGTVCIHEVTDTSYSESFTAVPDAGWEFVKWNTGGGFLCADSTHPVCVVTNAPLAGNPVAESLVDSTLTFYIMPIFEPAPDPTLNYLGSTKSVSSCISGSGEVVEVSGDSNGTQVCRFNAATCPAGWSFAAGWSTTANSTQNWSQPTISSQDLTCNTVTATFGAVSSASGALNSGYHPWSNGPNLESKICRIVAAPTQEIQGDCGDLGITQATTISNTACSGAPYTSDVLYKGPSGIVLSRWIRNFGVIQAVASRVQIGCY